MSFYVIPKTFGNIEITPSTQLEVEAGESVSFTLGNFSAGALLLDNGVQVSPSIVSGTGGGGGEEIVEYSMSNIQESHALVALPDSNIPQMWYKASDVWLPVWKVYNKRSDSWVDCTSDISPLFTKMRYKVVESPVVVDVNLTQVGEWVDSGTTVDGNIVYKSNASYNVNSGKDVARITFKGCSRFILYIRSYAESNYDYTEAFALNTSAVRASGKFTTKGKQSATNYVECIYDSLDADTTYFVDVMYSKDTSVNNNDDRGYFYFTYEQ